MYYNDSNYVANEVGESITVSGDGQYTLTFNADADLSDAAKKAGINYLNNLTSIYIKDNDVTNGDAATSPLDGCEIRYDSIKVDGVELTITNTGFKSALKASGVFDTNDPINSWDGSAVAEVEETGDHVLNFTTVTDPTEIEITFTLRNLKFTEKVPADQIPAESIEAASDKNISTTVGAETEIKVNAAPANTTSLIAFVSSNEGVVMVSDKNGKGVDENGGCAANIIAVGTGTATVTAVSDNGLTETFEITVTDLPFSSVEPVIESGILTGVNADINYVPDYDSATVIAAVYSSDGTLSAHKQIEIPTSEITGGVLTVSGFDLPLGEGDSARAFIWNSVEDMIPLSR